MGLAGLDVLIAGILGVPAVLLAAIRFSNNVRRQHEVKLRIRDDVLRDVRLR